MKSSVLNDYILSNLEFVVHHLSVYIKDQKPESLHLLRLDIKKLKAVFSLAEYVFKEKLDTTLLKHLFQEAGKLREVYIHIQLLSSIPHPPQKLIHQLKKKENILIKEFIENGSKYILFINDFRDKAGFPEIVLDKEIIEKYFSKEEKKTIKILKNVDRKGMHSYRKKIKKINYIYNVLPEKMQNKLKWNESEINKKQKMLGDWHDTYAAIHFLAQ